MQAKFIYYLSLVHRAEHTVDAINEDVTRVYARNRQEPHHLIQLLPGKAHTDIVIVTPKLQQAAECYTVSV